ncbi:LysR family transcriptional regulator [Pseudomonas sp. RIT-PI-S]|uniref:LysR family transcriptional regulator n=1 Tax=Pseudomonas sp. RIT-PI-S TaxID=3035295 RepID=UPI0021D897C2|nr:LysR family transcriptional regulator [Pseudomonas sp. RIT-PI-S]
MRPFDLQQLHTFVVIAEAGSLAAASPRLNLSQSAVSEQLRKLESFVGARVFERGKQGVALTPSGERLLGLARELLALSERSLEAMRGTTLAGELRLAITDYFRPGAIAEILKALQLRYPDLRLHVSVRKSMVIEREGDSGEFDIGLAMRILDGRVLSEGLTLRREALHWVAAPGYRAPGEAPLPLLVLPEGCSLQRFVCHTLDKHRVPYVIAHSASGVAGLQSAVLAGLGVACLNQSAIPPGAERWPGPLPALPEVEFAVQPPREGEPPLVGEVRARLLAHFNDAAVTPLRRAGYA